MARTGTLVSLFLVSVVLAGCVPDAGRSREDERGASGLSVRLPACDLDFCGEAVETVRAWPVDILQFGAWIHDPSALQLENGCFMVFSSGYRKDYTSAKMIEGLGINSWYRDGRFVFTFHYYDGGDHGKARLAARNFTWADDWPVVSQADFFK